MVYDARKRPRDDADAAVGPVNKPSSRPVGVVGPANKPNSSPVAGMHVEQICSGLVVLRGLPLAAQQELLGEVASLRQAFFTADNEKTRGCRMMHLGKHFVGGKVRVETAVPTFIARLAAEASALAGAGAFDPDVAVINAYDAGARLGEHVDRQSRRGRAVPVVAFSLGDDAEFVYRRSWKKGAAERTLRLSSGDALVFWGKCRDLVHGMSRVAPGTSPPELRLEVLGGSARRVCVTCREH